MKPHPGREAERLRTLASNLIKAFPGGLVKVGLTSGREIYCEPEDLVRLPPGEEIEWCIAIMPPSALSEPPSGRNLLDGR